MATRRVVANLAQLASCSARTAQLRAVPKTARTTTAAARLALRQFHSQLSQSTRRALVTRAILPRTTTAAAYYSSDSAPPPAEEKPSTIWDFEAIQKLISSPSSSVTLIDSREPSELQETGRIPGAINIPVKSAPDSFFITEDEFEDRYGFPRPSKDTEVVFYCKAGVRSRAAAGLAKDAGWKNVGEYPGSWLDWFEKGGKIER